MLKFRSTLKVSSLQGVTVLGDVLRPNPEGMPGGVDGQIGWLHLVLRHTVQAACGLAPKLLSPSSCPTLHGLITAERSPAAAPSYWAARHGRMLPRSPIRDLLEEQLTGQFCIGYELPPYLVRLLDTLRVPYIDLRVHSGPLPGRPAVCGPPLQRPHGRDACGLGRATQRRAEQCRAARGCGAVARPRLACGAGRTAGARPTPHGCDPDRRGRFLRRSCHSGKTASPMPARNHHRAEGPSLR